MSFTTIFLSTNFLVIYTLIRFLVYNNSEALLFDCKIISITVIYKSSFRVNYNLLGSSDFCICVYKYIDLLNVFDFFYLVSSKQSK